MRAPTPSTVLRRNLTAKKTMSPAISSEKNPATPTRKKYSASTRPAIVEALSGNRGGMSLFSKHDHDERGQDENRGRASNPHGAHDEQAAAAPARLVVIAVEQERVDARSDLARRRFDDGEPQVAGA